MTERGILFSGAMVRALLDGTKTQTRRPYKVRYHPDFGCEMAASELVREEQHVIDRTCPYGRPGERLWVRETCAGEEMSSGLDGVRYGADDAFIPIKDSPGAAIDWLKLHTYGLKSGRRHDSLIGRKVPSIHMPRWASRILLEIVSVRVERLQDISEADAISEGIEQMPCAVPDTRMWRNYDPSNGWTPKVAIPQNSYRSLWDSINGAGSWDANPWVWVVEFRRIEG